MPTLDDYVDLDEAGESGYCAVCDAVTKRVVYPEPDPIGGYIYICEDCADGT